MGDPQLYVTAGQPAVSGRLWTSLAEDPTLTDATRASRRAWALGKDKPAADAMGSAAAALAAAATVLAETDPGYSEVLTRAAIQLYQLATSTPGKENSYCGLLQGASGGL